MVREHYWVSAMHTRSGWKYISEALGNKIPFSKIRRLRRGIHLNAKSLKISQKWTGLSLLSLFQIPVPALRNDLIFARPRRALISLIGTSLIATMVPRRVIMKTFHFFGLLTCWLLYVPLAALDRPYHPQVLPELLTWLTQIGYSILYEVKPGYPLGQALRWHRHRSTEGQRVSNSVQDPPYTEVQQNLRQIHWSRSTRFARRNHPDNIRKLSDALRYFAASVIVSSRIPSRIVASILSSRNQDFSISSSEFLKSRDTGKFCYVMVERGHREEKSRANSGLSKSAKLCPDIHAQTSERYFEQSRKSDIFATGMYYVVFWIHE